MMSNDDRLLGGGIMFLMGLAYMIFGTTISDGVPKGQTLGAAVLANSSRDVVSKSIIGAQVGLIALSMIVTSSSVRSLQQKQGLPLGNQILGWSILVLSLTTPLLHALQPNPHYFHRLTVLFLTFAPIFVLLSISYEGLFYIVFATTLHLWISLESLLSPPNLNTTQPRALKLADLRLSLALTLFLQSAFFSTGNIASISSFSLDSVYRLLPIFSPFAMGALLVLKLLIPFALISANLAVLNRRAGLGGSAVFMCVTALSDVLTLNFFWLVRDEGSWLEIGTGISHFCIGGALGVFLAGLEGLGTWWGKGVEVHIAAATAPAAVEKETVQKKEL